MTEFAFYIAASLSAIWTLVHLTAGEADIARPLRRAHGLEDVVRDTSYLCWHMVSVTLGLMSVLFVLGAWVSPHYAVAGLLLAAGFAILGVALVPMIGARYRTVPQGWLFVPVVAAALVGLLA